MTTLASTNRVQLSYIPEVTFGVTPNTGTAYNLRMTGESLGFDLTKDSDKEIRSDRQRVSSTTTNASATGGINIHMQYGEYDRLFAALMQDAWVAFGTNGVGTTFTADFTATTITASVATSGTSIFTGLKKGQWFRLIAPTNANNGKLLRVSTSVAPTSTVITLDASTPAVVGTAVANCVISSSRLSNGVTLQTFSIERAATDVGKYFTYRGMSVSKFATSFASASMSNGTFSFMGKDLNPDVDARIIPSTQTPSLTFDVQNAVTGVGNVWENGAPLTTTFIKTLSLDVDNSLRAQDAIGTLGAVGIGVGTFMAKGSIEIYFADGALYEKFLGDVFTSFSLSTQDTAGNGYVFTFPRVQLTKATVVAGSKDTDLTASFDYEAYADIANADATLRKTLLIDRVGAAVLP